jgi:hypothetical protein
MASGVTKLGGAIVSALVRIETSSWAVALAEKARGVAHGFADSMSSGVTKIVGAIVSALTAIRSSSIATTIAENARAVAHAIANAVASLGVAVPIIIAAAAAAAVGVMAYTGNIPRLAEGGLVMRESLVVAGEDEPEVIAPLHSLKSILGISNSSSSRSVEVNLTVYCSEKPYEVAGEVRRAIEDLRSSGVI